MAVDPPNDDDDASDERDDYIRTPAQYRRQATLFRDRERCTNCLRSLDEVEKVDVNHGVPRGVGGSSTLWNLSTLCRDCHEAVHGERELAPTVEFMSTGRMSDDEFRWYKHFWDELLPAMSYLVGPETLTIEPMFGLDDRNVVHIPLGEIIRFAQLEEVREVPAYNSVMAADFM